MIRQLVWLLVMLLILMPLLSQAQSHWPAPLTATAAGGEMPCHQQPDSTKDHGCKHCSDGSLDMVCTCCDLASPHKLVGFKPVMLASCTLKIRQPAATTTDVPQPPTVEFYRPPRHT